MSLEQHLAAVQRFKARERELARREDELTLRQQALANASPAAYRDRRAAPAAETRWAEAMEARASAVAAREDAATAWAGALDGWQAELDAAQRAVARADSGSMEALRLRITSMLAAEVGELSPAELTNLVDRALGRPSQAPRPAAPVDGASDAVGGVGQEAELVAAWALEEEVADQPEAALQPVSTPAPGALDAAEVDGPVGQDELDLLVAELDAGVEDEALGSVFPEVVVEPEEPPPAETEPPAEAPPPIEDDVPSVVDQDAIDALLAAGPAEPDPAPAPAGPIDQDAIDALLAAGPAEPAPAPAGPIDQDAIDALLAAGPAEPDPAPAPAGPIDQDTIDALLAAGPAEPELVPEPELDPVSDGPIDQDAIDALLAVGPEVDEPEPPDAFAALLAPTDEAPNDAPETPDEAQAAALSVELDFDDMESVLEVAEAEQAAEMAGEPSSLSEALAAALGEERQVEDDPFDELAAAEPEVEEADPFDELGAAEAGDFEDMFARLKQAESQLDADDGPDEAPVHADDPWAELEAQLAEPAEEAPVSLEPARRQQRLPEMDELDSLSPALLESVREDLKHREGEDLDVEPIPGYDAASPAPGPERSEAEDFAPSVGQADLLAAGQPDPYDAMLDDLDPPSLMPGDAEMAPARFAALAADGAVENDPWAALDIEDLRAGGAPRPLPSREPNVEVIPTTSQRDEVQRQARAQLAVKVGMEHGNAFFTGFSGNVSSGGLFVATHQLLEIGSQLELFFEMPDGHEVGVVGEVRWRREYNPDATDQPPGMGLRFLNLGYDDQILIDRYIANHETIFYD